MIVIIRSRKYKNQIIHLMINSKTPFIKNISYMYKNVNVN